MKKRLGILLIINLSVLTVFGFSTMGHETCLAALVKGEPCPGQGNVIQFLTFHFEAFKNFSTAVFSQNFASTLFVIFSLIILGLGIIIQPKLSIILLSYKRRQFSKARLFASWQNYIHWLALLENSPTSFPMRRYKNC